jgi:hypothetical protein
LHLAILINFPFPNFPRQLLFLSTLIVTFTPDMTLYRNIFAACLLILLFSSAQAQKQDYKVLSIGFYNVENLFDTINQPDVNDEEFTPEGSRNYTAAVFNDKLSKLSDVISMLATDYTPDGVAILGVAEVENRSVLEALSATPKLKSRNYQVVHYDAPDQRGIDVALLYNPKYFKETYSEALYVELAEKYPTRDVLYVEGMLGTEKLHIFVNHWPSRRGGEEASAPGRAAAAAVNKHKIDSITTINPKAKIVVMGDLNDEPTSPSVTKVLGAVGSPEKVKPGGLFNPWVDYYKKGIGTLAYQDAWGLFDQIILSSEWLSNPQAGYRFYKASIFNREFMVQKTGRYKGYPMRTYDGNRYNGGYSDHFPTYIIFVKPVE